jgi:hypothetical protein
MLAAVVASGLILVAPIRFYSLNPPILNLTMDLSECYKCGDSMSDCVQCSVCANQFHFHCAGITEVGYRKLGERKSTWRCVACKQGGHPGPSPVTVVASSQRDDSILYEIKALAAKMAPLESLAEDMKLLRSEFTEMRSSLAMFNAKVTEFDKRLVNVEKALTRFNEIETRISVLEEDVKNKEQWARMNNVELKGVPEIKNENLYNVVANIGAKVSYTIDKTQINFITRVPTRDSKQAKPIIVCFNNRYVKENFVAAARIANRESPLVVSSVGFKGTSRIYINDHLTAYNKNLLSKVKLKAKELGFQYIWVKHAKIHVRRGDGSPIIVIKVEKDLTKIV